MTIDRRKFVTLSGSALSAFLAACDSRGPKSAEKLLRYAERKNEVLERALFRHTAMDAPIAGARNTGDALPSYFISETLPVWDESVRGKWALEVGGLVGNPMKLTLEDLQQLPRFSYRVNHYCVEGWTAIETWTGCRVADLARLVRAAPEAGFVDFESFDNGYHESWDLESAVHPQTLIAYALDGKMLQPAWGAPARLFGPVKLGYKNTKFLTRVMFLPRANGGFWSDQGYEWYAGV